MKIPRWQTPGTVNGSSSAYKGSVFGSTADCFGRQPECGILPTGSRIFQGIREEAHKIKALEILEGHTEENIETNQTGMGIQVVGRIL
jgi:hypothetical protein